MMQQISRRVPPPDKRVRINRRLIITLSTFNILVYPIWIGFRLFYCWNEVYCTMDDGALLCLLCDLGAVIAIALVISLFSLILALADLFKLGSDFAPPIPQDRTKARRYVDACLSPAQRIMKANEQLRLRNADPERTVKVAEGLGWFTFVLAVVSIVIGLWFLLSDFRMMT